MSEPLVSERLRRRLGDLAQWLADPGRDEAERAAFTAYTRQLTAVYWPWLGYGLAAAAILWWPLDAVVFHLYPRTRWVYGVYRLTLAAMDITIATALPKLKIAHRHAELGAIIAYIANLALTGWVLAEGPRGDALWFYFSFMTPQFSVLLLVPLGMRFYAAFLGSAVIVAAWGANPSSSFATPGVTAGISFLVFCTLLAVFIGHVLYAVLRRGFYLSRRVEVQREDLAMLADRLERRVDDQTRALRALHHRAQDLRAQERHDIARDLHDDLGQELTSLRLLVGLGRQLQERGQGDEVLNELDEQIGRVQQSLRRVLVALKPRLLDEQGLVEALRVLVRELESRSGLAIPFEARDVPEPLPAPVSTALFRIAQEALNNALRHARASRVDVRLIGTSAGVRLEIEDDGAGIAPGRIGSGQGTLGIRERAEALGGDARWSGQSGTLLTVNLPLEDSS
ncbi:MAG: sensor histidine kinase [Alphaproteobacteria bacterium]|nr:sensor histidine kinase [Alphaproteobacteria bacterium]